jgi:hypothetical protein
MMVINGVDLTEEPTDEVWEEVEADAAMEAAVKVWVIAVEAASVTDGENSMVYQGVVGNIIEEVIGILVAGLRDEKVLGEMYQLQKKRQKEQDDEAG